MNSAMPVSNVVRSPFNLDEETLYQSWREQKLKDYPETLDQLLVEIDDPRKLTDNEYEAILKLCQKTNMALYASKSGSDPDHSIPIQLGKQFGLNNLDHNWLSENDGLTALKVADNGARKSYIPYSDKPIKWHTDGYYNEADQQIHALLLHCVKSAISGGENQLLDHEIVYLMLRDENPDYIRAMMQDDMMIIPARYEDGEVARAENVGPVFSIDATTGNLHMRYTIRSRNIVWKEDALSQQALGALTALLNSDSPYIFKGRLEPGMGLVCNNVLHDRSGFSDDEDHRRLLYRARYYDRIANTDVGDLPKS